MCSYVTARGGFHPLVAFCKLQHVVFISFLLIKRYLQMLHHRWVLNRRSRSCRRVIDLLYFDGGVGKTEWVRDREGRKMLGWSLADSCLRAVFYCLPSLLHEWDSHFCFPTFFSRPMFLPFLSHFLLLSIFLFSLFLQFYHLSLCSLIHLYSVFFFYSVVCRLNPLSLWLEARGLCSFQLTRSSRTPLNR